MNKRIFSIMLVAGIFAAQAVIAQDHDRNEPKFKKTKSFSKSYSLSSSDKINLSNQFGEMKLTTWDKNEIKVDVSITGKADEEARAQQILDKISIEDSKSGNLVSFKTKFADDKWNRNNDDDNDNKTHNQNRNENRNQNRNENGNKEHHNEGMEINYTVYLPATNSLTVSNQFGKTIMPDYRGELDLETKFGSLTAGKLSNTKEVTVEFGEATIASINGGDLNIKFSSGTVNELSGSVRGDMQFSQVKLVLDNDTKGLNIDNSYSTIYLDLDKNFSGNYDISTSHGGFKNQTSFNIKEEGSDRDNGYGPRFNNRYTGTSGGGAAKIKISSSFGEVVAGHNLTVDLSKKERDRPEKNKTNKREI